MRVAVAPSLVDALDDLLDLLRATGTPAARERRPRDECEDHAGDQQAEPRSLAVAEEAVGEPSDHHHDQYGADRSELAHEPRVRAGAVVTQRTPV